MLHLLESLTPEAAAELAEVSGDAAHVESGRAFDVAFTALLHCSLSELNSPAFAGRLRHVKRVVALREEAARLHGMSLEDRVSPTDAGSPATATVDECVIDLDTSDPQADVPTTILPSLTVNAPHS